MLKYETCMRGFFCIKLHSSVFPSIHRMFSYNTHNFFHIFFSIECFMLCFTLCMEWIVPCEKKEERKREKNPLLNLYWFEHVGDCNEDIQGFHLNHSSFSTREKSTFIVLPWLHYNCLSNGTNYCYLLVEEKN